MRKAIKTIKRFFRRNSATIMTGAGVTLSYIAVANAIKVTPEAKELIEERKEELCVEELPIKETIKTCWKLYLPSASSMVASTALIFRGNKLHIRDKATLIATNELTNIVLEKYRETTRNAIGEKKEKLLYTEAEHMAYAPKTDASLVYHTPYGNQRFHDCGTGREFYSDMTHMDKALSSVNSTLSIYGFADVSVFYNELDIDGGSIAEDFEWNADCVKDAVRLSIDWKDDGVEPIGYFSFSPRPDYLRTY